MALKTFARGAALLAALAAVGCVGETPPNPISAPDINRLTVFFPVDTLVNGRGSPGPVPAGYEYVFIRPHPSRNVSTFVKINKDGSFSFRIAATGNDILEMAYAQTNDEAKPRGASAFIEVPLQPSPGQAYHCCLPPGAQRSKCNPVDAEMCSAAPTLTECSDDADCAYLSGARIPIAPEDIIVTQPDASGLVTVTANNPAYALHLLRIQNRAQRRATDTFSPDYVIADESGKASVSLRARGDDEVVIRIFDIDGYTTSREHALYVPDSDFAGLDVVGVFPFEGLSDNQVAARIGVRLAPYGVDARGICAPSNEPGPALCFSGGHEVNGQNTSFAGGLDYAQVTVQGSIGSQAVTFRVPPPELQMAQNTKFTDGNMLAPPQTVALIVDDSADADLNDVQGLRFRAAENFLRSARQRDQVVVFATGSHDGMTTGAGYVQRTGLVSPSEALANLLQLSGDDAGGSNGIYAAAAAAGNLLYREARGREGRVLIIGARAPGDGDVWSDAVAAVSSDDRVGKPAYPVYVVTRPLTSPSETADYASLPGFTAGQYSLISAADEYLTSVAQVTGAIFGAYVLMYLVDIPAVGGKSAPVSVDVTVKLPNPLEPLNMANVQEQRASYTGTIELRNNVGN